ncbi:hypothetical protein D9M70_434640 [compost metagenome]
MPDHPALVRATRARGADHLLDRRTHGMELVIAGNLLHQPAVILEQHEVAHVIEQHGRLKHATNQRFQLVEFAQRIDAYTVNGAPASEAFRIRRQRAHTRLAAIGNHQDLVVLEHIRDLFLVSLNLLEGLPDIGIHVRRILQFQQHQRQAVDEQDDVGPTRMFRPLNTELIDRQPLIAAHIDPVDQPHEVAARLTILLVLNRDATDQKAMEQAVGRQLHWHAQLQHLSQRILSRRRRYVRVQLRNGTS